jgi:osmotically-inducible protein OsmY
MSRKLLPVALMLSLWASAAVADEKKDFRIGTEVSAAVNRYPYFTIFDDITIYVQDGVVTLGGKVTMPMKSASASPRSMA